MDVAEGRLEDSSEGPRSLEIISSDVIAQDPERLHETTSCQSKKPPLDHEDCMDITKGSLDDISRPASSERSHAGSQAVFCDVRRESRDSSRSLEVLSPDVTDIMQVYGSTRETTECAEHSSDQEDSDEEGEDLELRKAVKKMKKLDQILALKVSAEKEVKQKGKELHHRLWQELQAVSLAASPESSDEMDNTRRFLALSPNSLQDCAEEDFVPVFETEVVDEWSPTCQTEENTHGDSIDQQLKADQHRAAHCRRKQDFVKKNIKLAGASVPLTQQERERLQELLRDLEEDQNNTDPTGPHEVVSCAVSLSAGEGFTPEPSELDSLLHIDSRLQVLLPVKDFLSVRSPRPEPSPSQLRLQSVDEVKMGDRVLWDARERREQERRLREIQQQLKVLDESEENTCRTVLVKRETSVDSPSGPSFSMNSSREDLNTSLRLSSTLSDLQGAGGTHTRQQSEKTVPSD